MCTKKLQYGCVNSQDIRYVMKTSVSNVVSTQHLKSGLIRWVASPEGIINQYFTIAVHLKSGLVR